MYFSIIYNTEGCDIISTFVNLLLTTEKPADGRRTLFYYSLNVSSSPVKKKLLIDL